jgi:hypothetical protein
MDSYPPHLCNPASFSILDNTLLPPLSPDLEPQGQPWSQGPLPSTHFLNSKVIPGWLNSYYTSTFLNFLNIHL